MRGEKIVIPTVRPAGQVEKVKVRPGMWLEMPAGLDAKTKAARVATFMAKLDEIKLHTGHYSGPNKKPGKHEKGE